MPSFQIGSCVFWEEIGVGTWSGIVKDRFMLGGLCLDITIDGVVVPPNAKRTTPAKAHSVWHGKGKFESCLSCVPAAELKVREPQADDDTVSAAWTLARATEAEASGVPAKQRAAVAALRV